MVPVVMVGVSVHQEFQASQEALDPRDQQVLRDHPVIMDLKDPWAHEETKVMKELVEDREHQASKELKDLQGRQVHVGTKVKQVQVVSLETRVIQVLLIKEKKQKKLMFMSVFISDKDKAKLCPIF